MQQCLSAPPHSRAPSKSGKGEQVDSRQRCDRRRARQAGYPIQVRSLATCPLEDSGGSRNSVHLSVGCRVSNCSSLCLTFVDVCQDGQWRVPQGRQGVGHPALQAEPPAQALPGPKANIGYHNAEETVAGMDIIEAEQGAMTLSGNPLMCLASASAENAACRSGRRPPCCFEVEMLQLTAVAGMCAKYLCDASARPQLNCLREQDAIPFLYKSLIPKQNITQFKIMLRSGKRGAITNEWALHTKTPACELKKVGHEDAFGAATEHPAVHRGLRCGFGWKLRTPAERVVECHEDAHIEERGPAAHWKV